MNILIMGGFLGSGKTTVLMNLLQEMVSDAEPGSKAKIALIENEVGQVSIDSNMLATQGLSVRNLFSGCACCTLLGDLISTLYQIREQLNPEWVFLETTGVASPGSILDAIRNRFDYPVKICIVADASRWKRIRVPMAQLLEAQVKSADAVLISKCDIANAEDISAVETDIQQLSPAAQVFHLPGSGPLPEALIDCLMSR